MKEDQVISLAVEAGAELDDGFLYIHTRVCSGFIERFAKLVEQETLERAAKVCRDAAECAISSEQESSFVYCSEAIRALKDSHD